MTAPLKQAPYGEPSFQMVRKLGYAYVDKTQFIPVLENCGTRFPFIVRPRRFGKSLFANMLMAYYDKAAAGRFDQNFNGTWIKDHPTPLASSYLVLKFDFGGVDGRGDALMTNFMIRVRDGFQDFATRYLPRNAEFQAAVESSYATPSAQIARLLTAVRAALPGELIYLIVDEYDQFAQNVLSSGIEQFRAMTGKEGFLKAFYAVIKSYSDNPVLIERTYITGVTSISLDSMTSGYNIATNITNEPEVAGMMGFTDEELRALIPQIVDINRCGRSVDEIFERMRVLYDGYRFSPCSDVTVFNSSMCLHYLRKMAKSGKEPRALLDPAFSVNLDKIEGILSLGRCEFVDQVVSSVLFDKTIELGELSESINLNASMTMSDDDVLSTLVYMGFLTFSPDDDDLLTCPNLAVKEVFFKYWFRLLNKDNALSFPSTPLGKAMVGLEKGEVKPLLQFVGERLSQCVGGHVHAHLSETAIQLAVAMAVSTSRSYQVTAEEEALGAGYTDLIMRPAKGYETAPGWLIEFKYLKKSDASQASVDAKLLEAVAQLERYSNAENIKAIPNLRRAAAVFAGTELQALKVF